MSAEDKFPTTVFVKELPEEYTLSDLTELLESFGPLSKVELMEDGHVLVRFQTSEAARKAVQKASGKKGNKLIFMEKKIHIIPKRNRGAQ